MRPKAFVINLARDEARWQHMLAEMEKIGFEPERVEAVDGAKLTTHPDFDQAAYRRIHGREPSPREAGCYLSHLKAMGQFMDSGMDYGLICEDDLVFSPDFRTLYDSLFASPIRWNVLRLSGLGKGKPVRIRPQAEGYDLCCNMGRLKGSGSYIMDRKAAAKMGQQMRPMKLPHDHAMDREWFCGVRALSIQPFPVSQRDTDFKSNIQCDSKPKLSRWQRYLTTYPYQVYNELSRYLCRGFSLLRAKLET